MYWKLFWEKIESKTHTIAALIAGILLLLSIFFAGDTFFSKYIPSPHLELLYIILLLLWVSYWLINRFYIPRNSKKKVGIVLCIYADSDDAEKNLRRDFIDSFKKQLLNEQLGSVFKVITIKNHMALKFNNFDLIKKLHKRVRGHIYIFGETKKRKNGINQYFLSLDGVVMHRPVPQNVSQELSKDFLATLPKEINFNDEFAFAGFQVSTDLVLKSVKYIVGLAAFISGDYNLALKLHTNFEGQMSQTNVRLPNHNQILERLKLIIANEYALLALFHFLKEEKDEANEDLEKALQYSNNCYRALLLQATIAFSWDADPKKALKIIKKCHGVNLPEWRYSETFLHFWLGNYPSALKQCEKIKKQNYPSEIMVSQGVTQFTEKIFSSNTSKPILYFWLGYNYYYRQDNLPMALKNFELFEQNMDNTMKIVKQKSSSWLIEIKRRIGI